MPNIYTEPKKGQCLTCFPTVQEIPNYYYGNLTVGTIEPFTPGKVVIYFPFFTLEVDFVSNAQGEVIAAIDSQYSQYFSYADKGGYRVAVEDENGQFIDFQNNAMTLNCLIIKTLYNCAPSEALDFTLKAYEPRKIDCGC